VPEDSGGVDLQVADMSSVRRTLLSI